MTNFYIQAFLFFLFSLLSFAGGFGVDQHAIFMKQNEARPEFAFPNSPDLIRSEEGSEEFTSGTFPLVQTRKGKLVYVADPQNTYCFTALRYTDVYHQLAGLFLPDKSRGFRMQVTGLEGRDPLAAISFKLDDDQWIPLENDERDAALDRKYSADGRSVRELIEALNALMGVEFRPKDDVFFRYKHTNDEGASKREVLASVLIKDPQRVYAGMVKPWVASKIDIKTRETIHAIFSRYGLDRIGKDAFEPDLTPAERGELKRRLELLGVTLDTTPDLEIDAESLIEKHFSPFAHVHQVKPITVEKSELAQQIMWAQINKPREYQIAQVLNHTLRPLNHVSKVYETPRISTNLTGESGQLSVIQLVKFRKHRGDYAVELLWFFDEYQMFAQRLVGTPLESVYKEFEETINTLVKKFEQQGASGYATRGGTRFEAILRLPKDAVAMDGFLKDLSTASKILQERR